MAMRCDNCKKGAMVGSQHKHHPGVAGGRWKKRAPHTQKIFKPNLHSARILIGGAHKKMKLCTKCLRILKADQTKVQKTKATQSQVQPLAL